MKSMAIAIVLGVLAAMVAPATLSLAAEAAGEPPAFRPPAVPLVAHDPYFSIWSCADRLTDDNTRHWTRKEHPLTSLIRVDGQTFRLMGLDPKDVPPMEQVGLQVLPTRTIYQFKTNQVLVKLTFMTPALPDDLDILSRPVTYLSWDVAAIDGREHEVSVYFAASGVITVNTPEQRVTWSRVEPPGLLALRIGSADQPVLQKRGDDMRIDWGYAYLAAKSEWGKLAGGSFQASVAAFKADGSVLPGDEPPQPRAANDNTPVISAVLQLGKVGAQAVSRCLMLAYDDIYSINYFGQQLRPYWRRNGADATALLQNADRDYPSLQKRCEAFDDELMADLAKVGGAKYAQICALAYRQCLAGNKLAADANGQPMLFPKENTSNGCIATVDVIYPMAPQFLLLSPTLAKASLVTVLGYAANPRWKWPFAPHDLGTYPQSTGQVYGGGERTEENQMPVEESGNMILLVAAIARIDGNADFASQYWPLLTKWVQYLEVKGFDPENQLCTDDFAGHLAHNANLSIKAIEAIAAYGMLCDMRGDKVNAARYAKLSRELAAKWVPAADETDHYRLAFDRVNTWSQKYYLVWDKILGLDVFPSEVARKEMAYYRKVMKPYGLPLDSRQPYTKTDWELWTATLARNDQDFQAIVSAIDEFLNKTPDRVPFSDFYFTHTGRHAGMHARPVIGGVFMKMLSDAPTWKKWASRDKTVLGKWAELPIPPEIEEVVPTSERRPQNWRYTTQTPPGNWHNTDFNDSSWKQARGGFGTQGTPGSAVRTVWNSSDIWLRRPFNMPPGNFADLRLMVHHDEDAEIHINGVLAAKCGGYVASYEPVAMTAAARAALRPGANLLAVHCQQTQGGQYIDVGLVEVVPVTRQAATISIDAGKPGQPISKYVYGQFIEHLGRCIYGGIWAEMLQDRKFFFAPGQKESPWKVIGPADAIAMVRQGAFVGEHTPKITLPGDQSCGIAHAGLGLVAGKRYVGRIWLAGSGNITPVSVSLVWGDGADDRQTVKIDNVADSYAKTPLQFTAAATTDDGRLEISAAGKGALSIGTLSLMPADNIQGMRPDTLELLKQLDSPVYRWPGGNFVSGYNWRDGIGDPDRRPPRKNPAWQGIEHNDFGLDEFMVFCNLLKTDPYIAVNSGLGDASSAAEEVQYANAAPDTPLGQLRARNGHPQPYNVKFWSIGNEMYGNWQLGHMPLENYQQKHNEFAVAMRKADPSIKLIAVGAVGQWSEGMMKNCVDHMDLVSEHFYVQEKPSLRAHVRQIPDNIRRIAEAHRKYRKDFDSLKGKDIRIALDEWNYWYGPHAFGELGTRYFLKDGLGIAAGIHEYARNSDIMYMANYAQTVNVIGCIKTSKTAAAFETTGLALKLYRQHFGVLPLATSTTGSIDAMAALSDDRKTLTLGIVNPSMAPADISLNLLGVKITGSGQRYQIAGNDPMVYNDPGKPDKVTIEEATVQGISDKITVAPCSVTLLALRVQ